MHRSKPALITRLISGNAVTYRAAGLAVLFLLSCLFLGAPTAQAQIIPIQSATAVDFDGPINFAALGPAYTNVPSGTSVAVSGLPDLTATFSTPSGLPFQVLRQCPPDMCAGSSNQGWWGNFAPNTPVLWTNGTYQGGVWTGNGPLTLRFSGANSQGCSGTEDDNGNHEGGGENHNAGSCIAGIGFQIMADNFGPFTAKVCAYDSANNLLSCESFSGNSNCNADNSAIFVGLYDPKPGRRRIASIAVSTDNNDFAISEPLVKLSASGKVPPGLVGWWLLNEAQGITANDSSGHGSNGTLEGAALFATDPQRGNALLINGISGEVDFPFNNILDPAEGTISVWVKPTLAQTGDIVRQTTDLLVRANRSGTFYAYCLRITDKGEVVCKGLKSYSQVPPMRSSRINGLTC
jgi:hypothetical protein